MIVQFNIHYLTSPGQNICVCGSRKEIGDWNTTSAFYLQYSPGGVWSNTLEIPDDSKLLEYKYILRDKGGNTIWEWGNNRKVDLTETRAPIIILQDNWRSPSNEEKVMYSSAFTEVIMKPEPAFKTKKSRAKRTFQFKMQVPRIGPGYQLCVLGNQKKLGNWDKKNPLLMGCGEDFPDWKVNVNMAELQFPVRYKYGIYNTEKKKVVTIEEGNDRQITALPDKDEAFYLQSDESFRYPIGNWKGAGVSVPVFSLRSEKGFGVGDFTDLIDFIDWAKSVNMKMVQILPVNETIASHNWLDSYPYKSISVMALHPIYMNLDKLGSIKDKKIAGDFTKKKSELNAENHVDYPEVLRYKSKYFKLIFDQEKDTFFQSPEYQQFFTKNKEWLIPYAAFVYLRDRMKSPDFREWGKYSTYTKDLIIKMSTPGSPEWDDIAIHYFIQFHLDKQLKEVADHARNQRIVLKGDIPIGISPNSVEAWTEPHLFHLNAQAGAPPDDFAIKGQNWGFPTYDWEKMVEEGYRWWKNRLQKMADYFDAYRIDHILGFFRIWEIPLHAVEGILGHFNPALSFNASEIEQYGIPFDYERLVKPYIRHHLLQPLFGDYTEEVISHYLESTGSGSYRMKKDFDTQRKVDAFILKDKDEEDLTEKEHRIRYGLFDLISNVLFIETGYDEWHPRISMHSTTSFTELDEGTKNALNELYLYYFYRRHDAFWYHTGMEKLPAILNASNMLVCGEDLGMVPNCVPPVMDQLNILSLEIQRMPKNPNKKFAHPADAPYLSICTTSTHDMPTIRGWWEENKASIQYFYNHELGNLGSAPFFAEPWICQQIITQHIHSPAMWTTFPIQDLIAMDGKLRWENTQEEQINHPSNVRHKWRYRMRQSLDDLKNANDFNELLKNLIKESGRDAAF
jgi:4-alpha-glucanotransferase